MSVTQFQPNDAALAAHLMTEEAVADLPFTSMKKMDEDHARISGDNRALVSNVSKLHGLTEIGDAMEGDEDAAREIIQAAQEYKADPAGYTDKVFGDDAPEIAAEESAPAPTAAAPAPAPAATPEPAGEPTSNPASFAFVAPEAEVQMIPRPASTLFQGIGSTYSSELIPTAKWLTPKPKMAAPDKDFMFNGYACSVMALAIEERKNVIATGDPGCGKTEFFKQFGAQIGLPVHKIPMDGSLSRAEIIGSFRQVATPNGSETPFVLGKIPRLIQQPCIIVLDEIDQADPDIMYMLHSVLEGEGLVIQEEGGTPIERHPHCYIVATANTKGRGSDNGLTHTRFEMSEATRDRFPYWLNFTFMEPGMEADTINAKTGLAHALCVKMVDVATRIRTAYNTGSLSQTCSLRQMLDVAPMAKKFASRGDEVGLALGMEAVMVGRANPDDGRTIREFIKTAVAVDLNTTEI
ncbi:AAA family ATPase [Erythrobacter aureus]|uniref:AAA family ATPase n=1 Tax=Erythrobacter aureus TaxID=2182384 RepID=A0A345YIH4_9SPHN|nr:AAA family ATPase [Erythrobacter aureus]AXK43726.1 AAA family ATPase [Erythrobacter aureus]